MSKNFLDLPVRTFARPTNMGKNGYPDGKSLVSYKKIALIGEPAIKLNKEAGDQFLKLQKDFEDLFAINLVASFGGGYADGQVRKASFLQAYSTNPAAFLASVNKQNDKSKYFREDSDTFRNNFNALPASSIYSRTKLQNTGLNEPLIVDGEFRGVPPYEKLHPAVYALVKAEHDKSLSGHNFLTNSYIKFYFEDGSKESNKWYYSKSVRNCKVNTG
jgi:hypothetical protein